MILNILSLFFLAWRWKPCYSFSWPSLSSFSQFRPLSANFDLLQDHSISSSLLQSFASFFGLPSSLSSHFQAPLSSFGLSCLSPALRSSGLLSSSFGHLQASMTSSPSSSGLPLGLLVHLQAPRALFEHLLTTIAALCEHFQPNFDPLLKACSSCFFWTWVTISMYYMLSSEFAILLKLINIHN